MVLYHTFKEISMAKKIFSAFFIFLLVFVLVFTPITSYAYEPTGIDLTAKSGMLVSMDTGEILFEKNIVRVRGINPKLWKFDEYYFQRMDENDEVFRLLCSFDDVDFDRYFKY